MLLRCREFDTGLKRYAPEIFTGDLRLEILPLRKDAPVFIEPKNRPGFVKSDSLAGLLSVESVTLPGGESQQPDKHKPEGN